MDLQIILSILIIVLLFVLILQQRFGSKQSSSKQLEILLRKQAREQREDIQSQLANDATEQFKRFGEISASIQGSLQANREEMTKQIVIFREEMTATLEGKMKSLQDSNEKRLEQMQGVVDEKLQKTLETRLSQSFETVGKHLESVQQGLGEMKSLAEDAKSLKHALTNVKDRGTYGEVRLEMLLEDILAPSQYDRSVNIDGRNMVDFAINLPGTGTESVLLPIDAKFPVEDYNRLMAAEDKTEIEAARKALLDTIKGFAKDISSKYIMPPKTTNFALMFLPTEGLYAEVIRDASLFEELREKHKIIVVGATTLSAFLGSLQIGFKTLAIEKHSQEVWETLGKVKREFKNFEGALNTAHKQIKTAEGTLEKLSGTRMRAIDRALRNVEELDGPITTDLLEFEGEFDTEI